MTLTVLTNAKLATMVPNLRIPNLGIPNSRIHDLTVPGLIGSELGAYGLIENGAVVIDDSNISWVGKAHNLPQQYRSVEAQDLHGKLVTPALIDCHTHLIYGGNRAKEFEMRLNGASYEAIARSGGGIVSTVKATRESSEEELLNSALERVDAFIAQGVTNLEIKSGYGLNLETELRMLRVARAISQERPIYIHTSFLAAHCLPREYKGRPDAYIDEVCLPAMEAAQKEGLVDAVDGFCENIAFAPQQVERLFKHAQHLNLAVKLHAEQLSNSGGAALAAKYQALSADHLEYLDEAGVQAMAEASTTAVLLPGAFYSLRESQVPPINLFRQYHIPMAVATDCNPGSSPLYSPLLAANMACTLFRLTPEEALAGITREAAKALGLTECGTIAPGKEANLAIWNVEHPSELCYHIGLNPLHQRVFKGQTFRGQA